MTITHGYATLDEVKAYASIPASKTDFDTAIDRAVEGASRRVDTYCQRRFWLDTGSTGTRMYKPVDCGLVWIDDLSTTAGVVVESDDNDDGTFETVWSSSDYELRPVSAANAFPEASPYTELAAVEAKHFPTCTKRAAAVRVTGKWGWPAVPHAVREATLMLSHRLHLRPGAPFAIATAGIGDMTPMRLGQMDPDVAALLAPYRHPRSAVMVR